MSTINIYGVSPIDIFRSLQPEAAPTESSQFTEPEAIMLENINEFNNQLSHWRQRLTIPNTDQIQVIRDRLDQTVSMVCHTQNFSD